MNKIKNLVLIHIGKCGGTTMRYGFQRNGFKYIRIHQEKPWFDKEHKYCIVIRNPIKRFLSAFNWRYVRVIQKKTRREEKTTEEEKKTLIKYDNLNNMAEQIYSSDGMINMNVVNEIKTVPHMKEDIDFYLGDFLKVCDKENIMGVLVTNTLREDMKRLFGIDKVRHFFRNDGSRSTYLSELAYNNLKKYLKKDYDCISKLYQWGLISDDNYKILSK